MAKKKQATKTAPPAPASSLQSFEVELAATLEDQQAELQWDLQYIKQHKHSAYEVILKIGREEMLSIAKESIQRTIRNSRMATLEEGRQDGYQKGLREGGERENGRTRDMGGKTAGQDPQGCADGANDQNDDGLKHSNHLPLHC